jgi:acyl transferase domain-containing protein
MLRAMATRASASAEPVAIVGAACRLPGASDLASLRDLLREGRDAVREVPADRWDADGLYDPEPGVAGKMVTRWLSHLDGIDRFDAQLFGITPREAETMDPQQRLLLEVTWEALEAAGIPAERLRGTETGVFVGIASNDYSQWISTLPRRFEHTSPYLGTGNSHAVAANRLSFVFDLRGPSVAVDTACSSSLVALHLARESLVRGESDVALVGGVNVILMPDTTIIFSAARMMSPSGRCRSFDAGADGYVRGEGCGVFVLKRLRDAMADQDYVHALVVGSGINQDGQTSGITVPNGEAQRALMRRVLKVAGRNPDAIGYVEAHGTATPIGDPVEVASIVDVVGRAPLGGEPMPDRLDQSEHRPSGGGGRDRLRGQGGPVRRARRAVPPDPLRAAQPADRPARRAGRDRDALRALDDGWHTAPGGGQQLRLRWHERSRAARAAARARAAVAHGIRTGAGLDPVGAGRTRAVGPRRALRADLLGGVWDAGGGRLLHGHDRPHPPRPSPGGRRPDRCGARRRAGAPSRGQALGRCLERQRPRRRLPACRLPVHGPGRAVGRDGPRAVRGGGGLPAGAATVRGILDVRCAIPLLDVLHPARDPDRRLDDTRFTQPALFALEYALTELWAAWGVRPDLVAGHSVGEYVAACVAGALGLEDALVLVAERGRLMSELPRLGGMAAVAAPRETVDELLLDAGGTVAVAAVNGPSSFTLSGEHEGLAATLEGLRARGAAVRGLAVSHAFHSHLMEPMLDPFERLAAGVDHRAPSIPMASNVTGTLLAPGVVLDAGYWRRHARTPVDFAGCVRSLHAAGARVMLEVGPGASLVGLGRRCVDNPAVTWASSIDRDAGERRAMHRALAALHTAGVEVDWTRFGRARGGRRIRSPRRPFAVRATGSARDKASRRPGPGVRQVTRCSATAWTVPIRRFAASSTSGGSAISPTTSSRAPWSSRPWGSSRWRSQRRLSRTAVPRASSATRSCAGRCSCAPTGAPSCRRLSLHRRAGPAASCGSTAA